MARFFRRGKSEVHVVVPEREPHRRCIGEPYLHCFVHPLTLDPVSECIYCGVHVLEATRPGGMRGSSPSEVVLDDSIGGHARTIIGIGIQKEDGTLVFHNSRGEPEPNPSDVWLDAARNLTLGPGDTVEFTVSVDPAYG